MFKLSKVIGTFCAGMAVALSAGAQAPAADKPIQLVVGFPPGQSVDVVARMLAERIGVSLRRNVVVDNRPGQGGSIALGLVAKAPPDGSMLTLAALASLVTNPHLYKNVQYDTLKDFAPIGLVYDAPLVLVVNSELPVKSVTELVAYAKANPGKLNHSSSGNGTVSHLGMVDFQRRAGIQLLHVPYQGSAPAMLDLMAGRVQVGMDTVAATLAHIKSGRLRLLAVCSAKRLTVLPDTPTLAEIGYPGYEAVAWIGMLAPAGTPKEFIARVSDDIRQVVDSEAFSKRMLSIGAQPRTSTTEEFSAFLKSEYRKWGELVRNSGAKVD